jgi:hypothetical protein
MDPQEVERKKEEFAREMFNKSFDECDAHQRTQVGGKVTFVERTGGGVRRGSAAAVTRLCRIAAHSTRCAALCVCTALALTQVGGSLKGGDLADPDRAPEPPTVRMREWRGAWLSPGGSLSGIAAAVGSCRANRPRADPCCALAPIHTHTHGTPCRPGQVWRRPARAQQQVKAA